MIKRINYTGRSKILREDARVFMTPREGARAVFRVELKLGDYGLPPDAAIRVEAYRLTTWMGFDFGTIAMPDALGDRELAEFGDGEDILFRVKVISADPAKRVVLAEADGIRGSAPGDDPDGREPILPVVGEDLGHLVWELVVEPRPILKMNKSVPDWRGAAKHPAFIALVFPQVLRQVLVAATNPDDGSDREDNRDALSRWIRFIERVPGVPPLPERRTPDEATEWVETAVGAFCRHQKLLDRFVGFWHPEVNT